MLYTGKGDKGDTGLFGCKQRMTKSSLVAEALGSLDEINSYLGICKIKSAEKKYSILDRNFDDITNEIQHSFFIIQAEMAGSEMTIKEERLRETEKIINAIEKELPPIKSFFVSGGTELAATYDVARTLARRAERRVVAVVDNKDRIMGEWSMSYLNRLSSLLYAMARFSNHKAGIIEQPPTYK